MTEIDYVENEIDGSDKPFAVAARFAVKEESVSEWLAVVRDVLDQMRHEPDFISTTLCADPAVPGRFMLFEIWRSRKNFYTIEARRSYRDTMMERMPHLLTAPPVFEEWVEERTDHAVHVRR